ncbi:MAG: hypothetical protein BWY41_00051 [Candidatus Atribacteria bacterium ADurb.Bin276]|uniref:Peptidase M15C domain-containing protein n=1 Tax=Candidatus Atribacter allofermentans TaxID=1852833 RepID=A0A1V5T4S0_9BACT|nr:MAG: hypothetical protein BWY41_00051 [Candidatus Atribacteria bacterium ADurb.Bin276]
MSLSEKQKLFTCLVAKLIEFAYTQGYALTFGEAWRPPEMAAIYAKQGKGVKNSLHTKRLAVDLNLFKGEVYLTKSEDYRLLGEYWESLDPLCRWGGRFKDGNHFSMEHEGVK